MYIREIEKSLSSAIKKKALSHNESAANYLKTQLKVAGIAVPTQRLVSKSGFSFSSLPVNEQLQIWSEIYSAADFHEVRSQALLFVERSLRKEEDKLAIWNSAKKWVKHTDNWAHSDALSSFYTKILEKHEPEVLPQLQKWNRSKNLWERRQSIVSLLYYRRTKTILPAYSFIEELVSNLLEDKEYYVQKGVGWTIREMRNGFGRKAEKFIENNLEKISPVAFTAAIENMPPAEKERLKRKRKQLRTGIY